MVFHESELEHRVSTIIQARADVRELHSQFPVLPFADDDGVIHDHTFDYYVVFDDGYRVAVAVKHARKRGQILDMFDRIARHDFSHVTDDLRLMTEEETYEAFYNAHDILRAREHFDEVEYETTRSIAKRLVGRFRFGELLRGCSHLGARRDAVWQLIDDGLLVPLSEMQHVMRHNTPAAIRHVQDTLKSLIQITDWPLHTIYSGVSELAELLKGDPQLANRSRVLRYDALSCPADRSVDHQHPREGGHRGMWVGLVC